jgi:type IV pilus assembly protein PilE
MLIRHKTSGQKGFTLIEMMIVVVIVAVLATIAFPSYQNYVRKARRSDAFDSLLYIQNLQEKWRANHTTYGTMANIGASANSNEQFYTLAIAGNTATAYTATATAAAGTSQASDTGCTALTITVNAANPRGLKGPAACWQR